MITINQAAGLLISISLTIVFIMIGYQLILILQEIRQGLRKINQIIDRTRDVSEAIAQPVTSLSSFLSGLKTGKQILSKSKKSPDSQE